jgi:hypothetical protein
MNCRTEAWTPLFVVAATLAWASAPVSAQEAAIRPTQTIALFNGRDLTGLYTWLKDSGREDPRQVFSVKDGALHVSGEGMGYIATQQAYRDYHLTVEYKWGQRTDGGKYVRNSGVLLHATGPDGNRGGVWMNSIECQLAQGCEGDFIVIRGGDEASKARPATITSETVFGPDRRTRWKRGGEKTVYSGKQFWWSRHDPEFKELLDMRGRFDVASPLGEWTRLECLCSGDRITVLINGVEVNECFAAVPSAGKILLQNEGFEVLFRKFELRPLSTKPTSN